MTLIDKALFRPTPTFRARRKRVLVRVQVCGAEGTPGDALVQDISASGMSAVARQAAPAQGEVVTVNLPDGSTLWGMVRWTKARSFGVEFAPSSREAAAAAGAILAGSPDPAAP